MPNFEFRRTHLPYCIQQLPNGKHVVLNRNYKPIGFTTRDSVDYEPYAIKFSRLTSTTVAKLSCKGTSDPKAIVLYDDGCVPTRSTRNMQQYLERLKILAKLIVET
jgi:hypothetical protein